MVKLSDALNELNSMIELPQMGIPKVSIPEQNNYPAYFIPERRFILILGNGFDLCSGLKSSFASFAHSDFWPLNDSYPSNSLPCHLNKKRDLATWFDLEQELFYYAHAYNSQVSSDNIEIDRKAFKAVHKALSDYLNYQMEHFIPRLRIPQKVINFFQELPGSMKSIYTFNYTSPSKLLKKMGVEIKVPIKYVHGSLENDNIIIGVGDNNELDPRCNYLYKAMSNHYSSSGIVSELDEADDVFIFGHSMGMNDYDYFNNFFLKACNPRNSIQPNLRITIFTKSEDDQLTLKTRIRDLSDKKLQRLINMCQFNIIPTNDEDQLTIFLNNYLQQTKDERIKE